MAFPQREVIHTEDRGGRQRRDRQAPEQAQQGVPAHRQAPLVAQTPPGLTPQSHAECAKALGEPVGAPGPGGGHGGQPFGEDAAAAVAITSKPLADAQLESHVVIRPRQISEGAFVTAVDAARRYRAKWTRHTGLRRVHE